MSEEVTWLPCPTAPGYEAGSNGRIRSVDRAVPRTTTGQGTHQRRRGVVLKSQSKAGGYQIVSIRDKTRSVHVMVCEAFHGPKPSPTHQVRHLNGISNDNRPENLCWGTPSENQFDRTRHGTNNQANKTRCRQGHEYSDANTYYTLWPDGSVRRRACRTCSRQNSARRAERIRLARQAVA